MFLFSITKNEIAQNFRSFFVEEFKIHPFITTIVVDNFLSKYCLEPNGFSIIESPLISSPEFRKIVFSNVRYDKNKDVFNIFKSTISGRAIYYHLNSRGEFFCSTHVSMLRDAGVTLKENIEALPEFFTYRIVMSPRTLYKSINQLCMADRLQIRPINGKCVLQNLVSFSLPVQNHSIRSIKDSSEEICNLLFQSIKGLTPCKNTIAVLLSGGIDSSILFKISQDSLGINESYSTGYPFEDPELNIEKNYAISAGNLLGVDHHYYEPKTDMYLSGFLEAIKLSETPLHHFQSVCLHLLFKNGIPKNKQIIIQGPGAGGSFGNFRNFLYFREKMIFKLLLKKPFHSFLRKFVKQIGKGEDVVDMLIRSNLDIPISDPDNPIWSLHKYGSEKWVCNYLNTKRESIIKGQYNSIKRFENYSIYDISSLYSLLGDEETTLSIWTKIGEGNKKILYSPFYEFDILNYVFSIPWKLKLKRPENILRKEIARQCGVPELIINRPKSGFGIRSDIWSKKGGTFDPLVPLASKVLDEKEIRKMQSSDPRKAMIFWNMLNYSIWKRLCIHNEPLEVLKEELNNIM